MDFRKAMARKLADLNGERSRLMRELNNLKKLQDDAMKKMAEKEIQVRDGQMKDKDWRQTQRELKTDRGKAQEYGKQMGDKQKKIEEIDKQARDHKQALDRETAAKRQELEREKEKVKKNMEQTEAAIKGATGGGKVGDVRGEADNYMELQARYDALYNELARLEKELNHLPR